MAADGGWRVEKCGWKNVDDKMRMEKCGWKIANDTMQMKPNNKIPIGEINLRCFLKVLLVTKSSHLIALRSGEVQYFIFNPKQPWSKNNRLDLYRQTPFFLHYIEEGLSLSTIKQISNAENRHYQIKWGKQVKTFKGALSRYLSTL